MKLKVLDLFSGIGGFSLGLERAGMVTVAFCEIDKNCRLVLDKHWPTIFKFTDIKDLSVLGQSLCERGYDWIETKDIDLICGGPPCTGHSVAGKKEGFKNEKSKLWEEYHRLVKEIKPKYCILENSPNLRNTGLVEMLKAFNEIGYNAEFSVLGANTVGAPHQRERLFIVFWRKGIPYCDPFRSFHADTQKKKATSSWWTGRRFKRSSLFKQASKIEPKVLQFDDGLSQRLDIDRVEEEIKQLGNSVVPQIIELIGKAILENET